MEKILVLDFGGQYNQLIARRVREQHVFAEVRGYDKITLEEIRAEGYAGIIFTGGPNSVYDETSPHFDPDILDLGVPVLGICYGHQLMAWMAGGEICSAGSISEYGKVTLEKTADSPLLRDIPAESVCWMSHTDYVRTVPAGFAVVAKTASCPCAAMENAARRLYGVQFHPEVTHTEFGGRLLHNFLFEICRCRGGWTMESYCKTAVAALREQIGDGKVLLALSGGVDSSVCAALLAEAIGSQLTCVFVDHGLMRKNEGDEVEAAFSRWNIRFIRVNAAERFLGKLAGVTEPERKRKIIGEMLESRVDALLLAPVNAPAGSTAYLSAADDAGVPLLFVTSIYADLARPCVMCDLYGGMKALMTRLYESGRRRIALLTGPRDVYCLDLRERGWRDFLVEHALPADAALHLSEVSYEAALTALRDYPLQNIDAAVCVNDMMALGAVNALLARGVRVPEDVAVAGYDDVIFSRVSPVPITTVRQDVHALAAAAVDRLLDMIEHRDPVKAVTLLPCTLIERESTGAGAQ